MFKILAIQLTVAVLGCVVVLVNWGPRAAIDVALGAATVALSLGLTVWALGRIFRQKTVALSVGVIVFKYAILGLILYGLVAQQRVDVIWYAVGISSLLPTVLFAGWFLKKPDQID